MATVGPRGFVLMGCEPELCRPQTLVGEWEMEGGGGHDSMRAQKGPSSVSAWEVPKGSTSGERDVMSGWGPWALIGRGQGLRRGHWFHLASLAAGI